nr:hypothetical protein L203_04819 [Cryptococcus depauperatus CBS 7841]
MTQRTYPTSPPPAYVQDSPKAKENMNVMTANAAASGSAQEQGSSSSSMTAVDPNRESESQPKNAEATNSKGTLRMMADQHGGTESSVVVTAWVVRCVFVGV